jgi:DNA-binding transcriptional LysR family regulator
MEFHQVRYFLAACNHMNFTRAAESCAVSQPALTVAIQKLEATLGGPLFLRDGRQLSLTSLGRVMRTHLGRIEDTRQAAYGAAAELVMGEMEHIELGIMCTIGPGRLGPALGAWQSIMPNVELVLHDVWGKTARELLLTGALDCALIARQDSLPDRFVSVPLMTESFELAYGNGHPLSGDGPIELHELNGVAYLDRLRCEFRETIFAIAEEQKLEIDVILRSEREDWIQNLVAAGHGVTMLPRNSIVVDGLSTRQVNGIPTERTIDIVTVRGRPLRKNVQRFVDFLAGYDWGK